MSLTNKGSHRRQRSRGGRTGVTGRAAGEFAGGFFGGRAGARAGRFRRRRGRGISATELRGFRKVARLLRMVGMRPRGLGPTRHRHRVTSV